MVDEGLNTGRGIIRFDCPRCLATIKVPASKGGREDRCPKCDKRLTIPEPEPEPEPEVEDEELELAPGADRDREPCRHCGKSVKVGASKCRHCQRWIQKPADIRADEREERRREQLGDTPIVLRIYGVLIVVLAALSFLGSIANFNIIGLVLNVVIIRIGLGLFKGQRSAVIGLVVIFLLGLVGGAILMAAGPRGGKEVGIVVLGASFVLYGIPALIGMLTWGRLTT